MRLLLLLLAALEAEVGEEEEEEEEEEDAACASRLCALAIDAEFIDEELADIIKFQHGYNAAARFVSVMDELLDTVINRLGV